MKPRGKIIALHSTKHSNYAPREKGAINESKRQETCKAAG